MASISSNNPDLTAKLEHLDQTRFADAGVTAQVHRLPTTALAAGLEYHLKLGQLGAGDR